jgi:HAE1 family hydrophobic/amphiphilic exporter-1
MIHLKRFIRFSLNNKFALLILTFIVTITGIYSSLNMKTEMFPDISVPVVTVSSNYPGAAPDEVMEKVTKPIEQKTHHLPGVTIVSSSSMENASQVTIQYDFAKDMVEAEEEVKKEIADMEFPEGVQTPNISRINVNAFPILTISMTDAERSLEDLTKLAEEQIITQLEGLEGVSSVQISGQNYQEVALTYDTDQLMKFGLNPDDVKDVIQGSAFSQSLGMFDFNDSEKSLVLDGNIATFDALKNMPIPVKGANESTVTLDDIADLKVVEKSDSLSRTNGENSIGLGIVKAPDANIVEVVNSVKEEMKQFEKQNPGLSITSIMDQGEPIEKSVDSMLNKVLVGGIFAIIIILLFLRDIRSTLIAIVSIPLSLLIALSLLKQADISLNLMTLGAMTIAIGRVVDDSIIVIENIHRRLTLSSEKLSGKELIVSATKEMFVPILSSTVVSIAIFLPLGLVEGAIGEMLLPFALTIVFALVASLVIAVTIVPMMSHKMMNRKRAHTVSNKNSQGKLVGGYKRILNWSLDHKLITFGGAIVLFAASLFLIPVIGFSFLPDADENEITMTYTASFDEKRTDVENLAKKAEEEILGLDGVETLQFSVGGQNPMQPANDKQAIFYVKYDEDVNNLKQEKKALTGMLEDLGGQGEWKEQSTGGGSLGETQMELLVYGSDMNELVPVVDKIKGLMEKDGNLNNIDSSISDTFDQYRIVADPAKLSKYGLSARQIAMELMPDRQHSALTTVQQDGKRLDVYVKDNSKTFKNKSELESVELHSPSKQKVSLEDVAAIEEEQTPNTITRRDDRIYASIKADIKGNDVKGISADLEQSVDNLDLPSSVEVSFGGVTRQMDDTFAQMGMAMLAAIGIVYLALVLTFGGGLAPFAVLFSLPFAIIGGLIGLFAAGEPLSLTALIGALMLIGIVVTNAIVLIDRTIHNQKEGLSIREALLEAGGTRLRPILMTAFSTMGALIPLAFGIESDGLISRGMGITVIGGLASSTILTLVIVPVVYEFLMRLKRSKRKSLAE